jgi:NitT/TauT family transport system ATP-binding protein
VGVGHVRVDSVTIRYPNPGGRRFDAVREISLDIEPGEFVTLLGPPGCGKSTILNAVAGFVTPDAGSISVDGVAVSGPSAQRSAVFQQESLFPWLTIAQNVEFGLKMQGIPRAHRAAAARSLLAANGLDTLANQYPKQLSRAMKQRVTLVRALATDPRVLLMDEPFGALDAPTRATMHQLLLSIWERRRISVLFATHDIDEATLLSDRIYTMTAGPGEIAASFDVPLSRPRFTGIAESLEFRPEAFRFSSAP